MDPTIKAIMDQALAKSHEDWLSQANRENQGMGFLSEAMRLGFSSGAARQADLAAGILSQRSVQAQPQEASGVAGTTGVTGK